MGKIMHKKRHRITRHRFEKMLGGNFEPVQGMSGRRRQTTGKLVTYKAYSKERQGELACFVESKSLGTIEGKTWKELDRKLRSRNDE